MEELEKLMHKYSEKLYGGPQGAQQEQQEAAGAGAKGKPGGDEDIKDADFEVK